MERPPLDKHISLADFNDFYWLKEELVAFCKKVGIAPAGGKVELTERIRLFLSTGDSVATTRQRAKPTSAFDWSAAPLTIATRITGNYKNTENVRAFFVREIGPLFAFNVPFMAWMKANVGQSLLEAIGEWKRLHELKKDKTHQTDIAPQFEYNKYMRAFMADNPTLTSKDAMKLWNLKRARRGTNAYERADLQLETSSLT